MAIEEGFNILKESFINVTIFGVPYIMSIFFVFITLLIITRDINKWKILMLPLAIIYQIIGIQVSPVIWILGSLLMIIEAVSNDLIGQIVQGRVRERKQEADDFIKMLSKERLKRKVKKNLHNRSKTRKDLLEGKLREIRKQWIKGKFK